ncbi:MAG: hypothetical protein SFV15_25790 [Polyangiaceae bacterium]|nr:hypothetical protein [Polyangiaceae bacterium]
MTLESVVSVNLAFARVAEHFGKDLRGVRFRVGVGRGHLLELVAYVPKAVLPSRAEWEALEDAVEALVEALLGTMLFDRWVGEIACVESPKKPELRLASSERSSPTLAPAHELRDLVLSVERDIHAGLPPTPWSEIKDRSWTLLELDPEERAEGCPQPDLVLVATCYPELVRCFLSGAPFDSARFSANSERFACLEVAVPQAFSERTQVKDALEATLETALSLERLGSVVGVGMGLRLLYFTLAVQHIEQAIASLRRCVATPNISSAWLVWMDDAWAEDRVLLRD